MNDYIFKFDELFQEELENNLAANYISCILGEPGIGKTSFVIALAKKLHTKAFILPCNQLVDRSDVNGQRLVPVNQDALSAKEKKARALLSQKGLDYQMYFYPHQVIADAILYAVENPRETPILFLDELNRVASDVMSTLLNLATARVVGSFELPENLRIITSGNDKGAITSWDEANVNRFHMLHVKPDIQTFFTVVPDLNPFIKNVLSAHPECLLQKAISVSATGNPTDDQDEDNTCDLEELLDEGRVVPFASPRSIENLSKKLNAYTKEQILARLDASTYQTIDGKDCTALQGIIEASTGRTLFSTMLLQEISQNIYSTASTQAATITVAKPSCYDDFKKCQDVTSLNDYINNMTEQEKSGCMLYLLYETEDNSTYIEQLAPSLGQLIGDDTNTLLKLLADNKLDRENLQTLLNCQCGLSTALNMMNIG